MWIEMRIECLLLDTTTDQPVLLLSEPHGPHTLPITLGLPEAGAIASELEAIRFPRPMTHDLLSVTIQSLGARVVQVAIYDLHEQTFLAVVRLEQGDKLLEIDARPSDAIALAVRCHAPILVSRAVLARVAEAAEPPSPAPISLESDARQLRSYLERLPSEHFGKYKI